MPANTAQKKPLIEAMFNAGAHYGFIKSRRHPTVKPFIFGTKNKIEIFDLEKTETQLDAALEFVKKVAASGKQLLFVSGKSEAKGAVKKAAESIGQPFVASRWVGGTFTNFEIIRKRVEKLLDLMSQKEKGELTKYTKKERLMIDREIDRLNALFNGITAMPTLPGAIFVVDSKKEHIAVAEARDKGIPVIALAGADCDVTLLDHAIVANDSAIASIAFFADKVAEAYTEGKKLVVSTK
ncbi:MAG: ribosomal protein small subunit ribosomal protein [Candidatus Parcubacteria bacterium]|jgi:small subunit ribosomal protein S2